ncbi:MAG: hypothetical protein ACJ8IQ_09400 [Chthoniobacterales bacterium]
MLLDSDPLRNERILQLLELIDVQDSVREGGIEPLNLRLNGRKLGFQAVDEFETLGDGVIRPAFDPSEELLLPFIGKANQLDIPPDLGFEFLLRGVGAVFARLTAALVGAAVVEKLQAALFNFPLARDAVAA